MVVQNNIPAINSHRNLLINNNFTAKNLEKLSSGFRINRAGDDAAGLAISEKMRGQIRGLAMAEQNTSNGISLIQTAEGGLNETHAILQRMRELAVQSSNGTYQDSDREQITLEFNALKSEIDRIASSTHYNQINLLDGTTGGKQMSSLVEGGTALGDTGTRGAAMLAAGFEVGLTITTTAPTAGDGAARIGGERATLIVNRDADGAITSTALQVGDQTFVGRAVGSDFHFEITSDQPGTQPITVATMAATALAASGTSAMAGSNVITGITLNAAAGNSQDLNHATQGGAMVGGPQTQLVFQIGANGGLDQRVGLTVGNMSSGALGSHVAGANTLGGDPLNTSGTIADTSIATRDRANAAIDVIDAAVNQVSAQRASLGALQNRLEHTLNNLGVTKENLTAAESTIRDVDMAKEMMEFTKNSILVQASQAMLAQANQLPQGVLSLLR